MLLSHATSLKTPLIVCAVCFFVSLEKGGVVLGLVSSAASVLLIAAMGFYATALLTLIVFAPLGIVGFFTQRLQFKKPAHIAIRVAISAVLANIALVCCYYLSSLMFPDVDFDKILEQFGGYFILAIIATLLYMLTDFLFWQTCIRLKKFIK